MKLVIKLVYLFLSSILFFFANIFLSTFVSNITVLFLFRKIEIPSFISFRTCRMVDLYILIITHFKEVWKIRLK